MNWILPSVCVCNLLIKNIKKTWNPIYIGPTLKFKAKYALPMLAQVAGGHMTIRDTN